MTHPSPLIQIVQLHKKYPSLKQQITAIHPFSLSLLSGETLGLVGESGCGKSTTGRCLLRLEEPTSGEIFYEGKNILHFNRSELFAFRRQAQMIFQDPYASLNPRMTAEEIIEEPFRIHKLASAAEAKQLVGALLDQVGLSSADRHRLPHEFSGGQRQRIGIARALALNPKFLVCDEPISSLDVSVQAQIINLLKTLQRERGLTYLFISHNLALVRYISDRVAVMYLGHLVELAPSTLLYTNPRHPYTQALLSAIPIPDPLIEKKRPRSLMQGEPSNRLRIASGCPFASRCPLAQPLCRQESPVLREISPGHFSACHFAESFHT